MADYQAVALGIKPADPSQAFDSINSILGMQQKRQGLQIQAQELQQQELKTQQQQGVQSFFQQWDPTAHLADDGTTDTESVHNSAAYKMAGNAKPLIDQQLIQIKSGQLLNKQALTSLNTDVLTQYAKSMGALADDPDVQKGGIDGQAKIKAQLTQFGQLSPDAARVAGIFGPVLARAPPDRLQHLLQSQQMLGADVLGQRGQQNPQQTTNAEGAIINREVGTGALSAAPGAAPGSALNPTSPMVAGATARTTGVGSIDLDRAKEISARIQPSQAAIGITQRVDDLAEQINSGKFSKWVMDKAAAMGAKDPSIVARQLLEKDLGQVKSAATAGAGTDQKMQTILSGYPEATSAPDTIHGAMDYIRGSFRQNVARGQMLNRYQEKRPNLEGFQHADDVLTGHTDPMMHEFNALKTREERVNFYKRNFHDRGQAEAFKNRVGAMGELNVIGQ